MALEISQWPCLGINQVHSFIALDVVLNDKLTAVDHVSSLLALVPELTPVYLLKVTGSFVGISEKGIPLSIWNSTAGAPQQGHKARFLRFRRNQKLN